MSDDFQSEIQYLGIEPSPAFVRQLEGKAYASFCTSCEPRRTFSENRRRFSSLTPWAFRGGLVPGILIQPVVSVVHRITAKQAVVPPGDHAFGIDEHPES